MTMKIFALFGLTSCVLLSKGIVPIDMGRTSLLDIGIYDVRCQAFNGKETQFPAGWTGDDPETGTVYTLGHRQDDKDALLLHSPGNSALAKPGSTIASSCQRQRQSRWNSQSQCDMAASAQQEATA